MSDKKIKTGDVCRDGNEYGRATHCRHGNRFYTEIAPDMLTDRQRLKAHPVDDFDDALPCNCE